MYYYFRTATQNENSLILQISKLQGRIIKDWHSGPVLVACNRSDHDIVGWVRHWKTSEKQNVAMTLTVNESHRGHKLGLHLMHHLITSTAGADLWHLSCRPWFKDYYKHLNLKETAWSTVPELFAEEKDMDQLCMTCLKKDIIPFQEEQLLYSREA